MSYVTKYYGLDMETWKGLGCLTPNLEILLGGKTCSSLVLNQLEVSAGLIYLYAHKWVVEIHLAFGGIIGVGELL